MQSFIAIDVDLMEKRDKAKKQNSNGSTRDLVPSFCAKIDTKEEINQP